MESNSKQRKSVYLTGEHAPLGWYICNQCIKKNFAEPATVYHCKKEEPLPMCSECGVTNWSFTISQN